ncbi:hypothetical protein GS540_10050 [Rhodococcus hoagii]|nr:hypothetical protein [Prescottella equi]
MEAGLYGLTGIPDRFSDDFDDGPVAVRQRPVMSDSTAFAPAYRLSGASVPTTAWDTGVE